MHNGQIAHFDQLRESLFALLPKDKPLRPGATDSELLFALALEAGLATDAAGAWSQTLSLIRDTIAGSNLKCLVRCSAVFSDGEQTYALRYSCDDKPPSLFMQSYEGKGTAIASEPVLNDHLSAPWQSLPPNSLTTISFEGHKTARLDGV